MRLRPALTVALTCLAAAGVLTHMWLREPNARPPAKPSPRAEEPHSIESRAVEAVLKLIPEDRLTKALPQNLSTLETAAGTLSCAPGLCRTIEEPAPIEGVGPVESLHTIQLSTTSKPRDLRCSEGPSGDPACWTGDLAIDGEQFYAFGDGCLYVRQRANAYFPLTKKYCEQPDGRLERKMQHMYAIGIAETAEKDIPVRPVSQRDGLKFVLRAGAVYDVVAADVAETDENGAPRRYLVRNTEGHLGWAEPEDVGIPQCGGVATHRICFHGD